MANGHTQRHRFLTNRPQPSHSVFQRERDRTARLPVNKANCTQSNKTSCFQVSFTNRFSRFLGPALHWQTPLLPGLLFPPCSSHRTQWQAHWTGRRSVRTSKLLHFFQAIWLNKRYKLLANLVSPIPTHASCFSVIAPAGCGAGREQTLQLHLPGHKEQSPSPSACQLHPAKPSPQPRAVGRNETA